MKRQISFAIVGLVFVLAAFGIAYLAWAIHPDETSLTYATWALAFLTLVLAFGIPITIWAASKEGEEYSKRFLSQEQDRFYAQLDYIYLNIQKMIIEHPHLAIPTRSRSQDEEIQYQAFAFIVWNFVESIYDFTREGDPSEAKREQVTLLKDTWQCILKHEGMLHAKWFANPENQHKFKEKFREDMRREIATWTEPTTVAVNDSGPQAGPSLVRAEPTP